MMVKSLSRTRSQNYEGDQTPGENNYENSIHMLSIV